MQKLISIEEASEILRIREITLRRFIKKQSISFHRIGKLIHFTHDDINEYLMANYYPKIGDKK